MMEKTPSSVSMGRRRGEITWMPEKARAWSGAEVGFMARASRDGEEERFLASLEMTVLWGLEMTVLGGLGIMAGGGIGRRVSLPEMRRPQSWRSLLKRR